MNIPSVPPIIPSGPIEATSAATGPIGTGLKFGAGGAIGRMIAESWRGTLFIIFAIIINLIIDTNTPFGFAGFDFTKYSSIKSLADINGVMTLFYLMFKTPLLVFAMGAGAFTLGRGHAAFKWFMSVVGAAYLVSAIIPMYLSRDLQQFFLLEGLDFLLYIFLTMKLLRNPTKEEYYSSVIFWTLVYSMAQFSLASGYVGALIHLLFIVLFTFVCGKKYGEDEPNYRTLFIVLILFDFIMPWILHKIPATDTFSFAYLPILLLGTIFIVERFEPTLFSTIMLFFAVIGSVVLIGWPALSTMIAGHPVDQIDINDPKFQEQREMFLKPSLWWAKLKNMTNDAIRQGSGADYYTQEVDENAKKKLGVYIETDSNQVYEENERVFIGATITGENFARDIKEVGQDPIELDLRCLIYKSGKFYKTARIYPSNYYQINTRQVENIRCELDPWELGAGTYEVMFAARFNFRTEAYLKRYFVSTDRLDALRQAGRIESDEDILVLNKVSDTNPVSKNSVGPVSIAANQKMPVITRIESDKDTSKIFGIKLKNEWEGRIERIVDLEVYLPEGIEIDKNSCNYEMVESELPNNDKYVGYRRWVLENKNFSAGDKNQNEIEQSCGLVIRSQKTGDLLGRGDVTTRYLRMISDYVYTFDKKVGLRITEQEGFHVKILNDDGGLLTSESMIKCIAKNKEGIRTAVKFSLYEEDNLIDEGEENCGSDAKSCEYIFDIKYPKDINLKCVAEAEVEIEGETRKETAIAFTKVKNSVPLVTVKMEPVEVKKGDIVRCVVNTKDYDKDPLEARFEFDGIPLPRLTEQCSNGCEVKIDTSYAENNDVSCSVMVYDGTDWSEEYVAKTRILESGEE